MKIKLLNDWGNYDEKIVAEDFEISIKALKDIEWLFGSYSYANYSGDAFVLFKEGDHVFEVNGGHCSCYRLEGQWEPELTSLEAIRSRLETGLGASNYCDNEFKSGLIEFLNEIEEGER